MIGVHGCDIHGAVRVQVAVHALLKCHSRGVSGPAGPFLFGEVPRERTLVVRPKRIAFWDATAQRWRSRAACGEG